MKQRRLGYNALTLARARQLRREMTQYEHRLWSYLRGNKLGVKFRRQAPVGRYVVDFVFLSARLIVELDGIQHYSPDGMKYDERRDAFLAGKGFVVLRFSNKEIIKNIHKVVTN